MDLEAAEEDSVAEEGHTAVAAVATVAVVTLLEEAATVADTAAGVEALHTVRTSLQVMKQGKRLWSA